MLLKTSGAVTYNRIKAMEELRKKRMGKIGSVSVRYVIQVSYTPNAKNKTIPVTSEPMITPLFQGCDKPASCNAKIKGTGQHTESMPPMPSRPRIRSAFDLLSLRLGMERESNTIAAPHMGPLPQGLATSPRDSLRTHFMKKIQRHVVRSAMMPPSNGPRRLDMVNTELITPE